ncbi:ABC transporter ATP-binding protein, partial [Cronobacter dublinensis subsp. dublinensis]|nr:ABC transporter ATP-binding protein [Cronobacter dublinensis subsp. dublinensis]
LIVMQHGQVVASGTPDEVLTEAMLREVFKVDARIEISPHHGKKHIHFL